MRQKLKDFKRLVAKGKMTINDVRTSVQCWTAYALYFDACGTIQTMNNLIFQLFGRENGYLILRTERLKRNKIYRRRRYIARTIRYEYRSLAAREEERDVLQST